MSFLESKVVPAQLSFLAIYNPSLGTTDETFENQIVYWYSKATKARKKNANNPELDRQLHEEENEKLRQIGLAQGMIDFAKSFSNGHPVDQVETEKSRIVLHELEKGWWILASIDLTRLPVASSPPSKSSISGSSSETLFEYSSREVSPPHLLLEQMVNAHRTYLLHNGASLNDLWNRLTRQKFCGSLERFWNDFSQTWDVLLHGNPSVDQFGGLKLAAGGELGIGVGEEDWGSGERDVLEDFARRTDGLVDLMVARFGEPAADPATNAKKGATGKLMRQRESRMEPWHGAGHLAQAVDGVVFSGIGVISRSCLRDISQWVQKVYTYGEQAFGVRDSPTSDRRRKKRRSPGTTRRSAADKPRTNTSGTNLTIRPKVNAPPGIPPPIVTAVERSLERATSSHDVQNRDDIPQSPSHENDGWTKYLTFGYGSSWGHHREGSHSTFKRRESSGKPDSMSILEEQAMQQVEPEPDVDPEAEYEEGLKTQIRLEESGHFIIGLKGDLNEDVVDKDDDEVEESNNRILLRTLHVEVEKKYEGDNDGDSYDSGTPDLAQDRTFQSRRRRSRLRVVVYVHRPFIYTFLFSAHTSSLSMPAFYRDLHTFFAPLHKPLSASTSPSKVAGRIAAASQTYTTSPPSAANASDPDQQPIFALVYDPRTLSIHASIPNIPAPGSLAAEGLRSAGEGIPEGWTRTESINVHSAILELIRSTRPIPANEGGGGRELERSVKTGRGWWVVWMRMDDDLSFEHEQSKDSYSSTITEEEGRTTPTPGSHRSKPGEESGDYFSNAQASDPTSTKTLLTYADAREAVLVRRARDAIPTSQQSKSSRGASGPWGFGGGNGGGKDAGAGWGPARLAEGVGIDARRYVEGLLSLNR